MVRLPLAAGRSHAARAGARLIRPERATLRTVPYGRLSCAGVVISMWCADSPYALSCYESRGFVTPASRRDEPFPGFGSGL